MDIIIARTDAAYAQTRQTRMDVDEGYVEAILTPLDMLAWTFTVTSEIFARILFSRMALKAH